MAKKKKKRIRQYLRKERSGYFFKILIFLAILLIISIYFLVFGKSGYLVHLKLKRRLQNLEREVLILKRENEKLKAEIKRLENDPEYIEKQARELGMIRRGEKIIEFIPSKNK